MGGQLTQRRVAVHTVHHGGIVETHGIVNFLCGSLCLACVFRSILVRIVGLRGHDQTGKRIDNVIAVRSRVSRRNIAEAIVNHGMSALTPSKPSSLIAERTDIRVGHLRKRVIKPGDNLACNKDCLRCSNFALLGFDGAKNLLATGKYLFKQRGSVELEQAFSVSKFGRCRRQCRTDCLTRGLVAACLYHAITDDGNELIDKVGNLALDKCFGRSRCAGSVPDFFQLANLGTRTVIEPHCIQDCGRLRIAAVNQLLDGPEAIGFDRSRVAFLDDFAIINLRRLLRFRLFNLDTRRFLGKLRLHASTGCNGLHAGILFGRFRIRSSCGKLDYLRERVEVVHLVDRALRISRSCTGAERTLHGANNFLDRVAAFNAVILAEHRIGNTVVELVDRLNDLAIWRIVVIKVIVREPEAPFVKLVAGGSIHLVGELFGKPAGRTLYQASTCREVATFDLFKQVENLVRRVTCADNTCRLDIPANKIFQFGGMLVKTGAAFKLFDCLCRIGAGGLHVASENVTGNAHRTGLVIHKRSNGRHLVVLGVEAHTLDVISCTGRPLGNERRLYILHRLFADGAFVIGTTATHQHINDDGLGNLVDDVNHVSGSNLLRAIPGTRHKRLGNRMTELAV